MYTPPRLVSDPRAAQMVHYRHCPPPLIAGSEPFRILQPPPLAPASRMLYSGAPFLNVSETQIFRPQNHETFQLRPPESNMQVFRPPLPQYYHQSEHFPIRQPNMEGLASWSMVGIPFEGGALKLDLGKASDWERLVQKRKKLQNLLDQFTFSQDEARRPTLSKFSKHCKEVELSLRLLKEKFKELSRIKTTGTEEQWNKIVMDTEVLKNKLNDALSVTKNSSSEFESKARKQRKKREWRKQRHQKLQVEKAKKLKLWKEKEDKIDQEMKKVEEEIQKKKDEEQTKIAADLVLREVKGKQSEAKEMLEVLQFMSKLRKARVDSAIAAGQRGGDDPADEVFNQKKGMLYEMMKTQLADYEKEESALRVMLQPTEAPRIEKDYFEGKNNKESTALILFGTKENATSQHPTIPTTLEEVISARREWDRYIAPPGTPFASGIPTSWIFPANPSSQEWNTFLVQKDPVVREK